MIVILHSIQLPENLGAIARVMKNFGLSQLRLITPQFDPYDAKAIATAAGADDILKNAQTYETLTSSISDIHYLYGTCSHVRDGIRHYKTPHCAMKNLDFSYSMGVLLGCEKSGLSQEDLSYCQGTLQIPTLSSFNSMNISQAFSIIAYEWSMKKNSPLDHVVHIGKTRRATREDVQIFFDKLEQILDETRYWREDSKKKMMKQNLQNLFHRIDFTHQEIQSLYGVLKSLKKYSKS